MKSPKNSNQPAVDPAAGVEAFIAALDHPLKTEIGAACKAILEASPSITEGIKWNAPSFRTTEWFATTNLRSLKQVQFIFHLGAKVRQPAPDLKIEDPDGLLKWLAKDRCLVTLPGGVTASSRRALVAIVRQWISYV